MTYQVIISELSTLLQRVFLSLDLYKALGYKGVLVSPELVHNVLSLTQDEGKVPEEILEVIGHAHYYHQCQQLGKQSAYPHHIVGADQK